MADTPVFVRTEENGATLPSDEIFSLSYLRKISESVFAKLLQVHHETSMFYCESGQISMAPHYQAIRYFSFRFERTAADKYLREKTQKIHLQNYIGRYPQVFVRTEQRGATLPSDNRASPHEHTVRRSICIGNSQREDFLKNNSTRPDFGGLPLASEPGNKKM